MSEFTRPGTPGGAEIADEACPVPGRETLAQRTWWALLRPVLSGVDALYLVFQSTLKSMGMVAPEGSAPEAATERGRYAVLPEQPGRWPELRVRLPDTAVHAFSVESMFRRAGMWRVPGPLNDIVALLRSAADEAWPSVRERRRGAVLELSFEGGGLTSTVKLSPLEDGTGGAYLSVGQKIGRLRYDEARRLLGGGTSERTGSPHSDRDADLVPVLAAVIRRGDRWLVARRPAHKRHGGLWEFPGGKLEPGEAWLDAARRELREELGVAVTAVGEPLFRRRDPASSFEIVFVPVEIEGEPQAIEHQELRWIAPAETTRLELAPADAAFVRETVDG